MLDYKLIGQRIKKCRKEKAYSQENIAEFLEISVSYVSRVERAVVKISLETLVRIAVFLEVTPAFLIDGSVRASEDYLQMELCEVVSDFGPDQMRLLLDIARVIKNR